MKKRNIILIIAIPLLIIASLVASYLYFSTKSRDFLHSYNSAASATKNYISHTVKKDDDMSFAVLSDSETQEETITDIYKKIINNVNDSDAQFLIHIGDFTNRGLNSQYEEFIDYMDNNLDMPYYVAPGNHDILQDEETRETFKNYFQNLYYSFDNKNAHFIVLDNSNRKIGFDDEQLLWLENDLSQNRDKQIFIFMHRPIDIPYAEKIDISDGATKSALNSYAEFRKLLIKYTVKEIFAGHIHIYFSYRLEDVPVIITGGAGSEPNLPFWSSSESFTHYILAKVRADNSYTTKVVTVE